MAMAAVLCSLDEEAVEMKDLNVMEVIMSQKEKDIQKDGQMPLNEEGSKLASEKRITFDIIAIPSDPLR